MVEYTHHEVGVMSEERREQILETSYEILGARGLEGLHARSVAAEIGVNHASVHYYFATRGELLEAVAGYAMRLFERDLQAFRVRVPAPQHAEADHALFRAYCKPTSRFFRVWASLFVAGQVDERIRAALTRFTVRWVEVFRESMPDPGDAERRVATLMGLALMAQTGGVFDDPANLIAEMG